MKVLVALPQPPAPEGSAPARCGAGLLRGLAAHGVDVVAVAAAPPYASADDVPGDLPVEVVAVPGGDAGLAGGVRELVTPHGGLARSPFGRRVTELAASVDVAHLDQVEVARCDTGAAPAAVHLHYRVRLDRDPGPPWTARFREVSGFARAEAAAARSGRRVVASSPVVAADLQARHPGLEVTVAPLTLDERGYAEAPLDGPPRAGVIGTASWAPSRGAMTRLADEVWPAVRRVVPDAEMVVAGRGTEALALSSAGLRVAGEVPSSAEFLRSLSVLLYPVPRGSGMKVKVLEALACGVPVVTTAAGAEGVAAGDGVVVCETAGALAQAAASILRDERERRQRGAAARRLFEQRYAPRPATAPLVELYRQMADR